MNRRAKQLGGFCENVVPALSHIGSGWSRGGGGGALRQARNLLYGFRLDLWFRGGAVYHGSHSLAGMRLTYNPFVFL